MGQAISSSARAVQLARRAVKPSVTSGAVPPATREATPSPRDGQLASKDAATPEGTAGQWKINGMKSYREQGYHETPSGPPHKPAALLLAAAVAAGAVALGRSYHDPPKADE
ncbi:hypothetical protein ACP70R_044245 [Stipagrostis hirtigluma subsp. patula]